MRKSMTMAVFVLGLFAGVSSLWLVSKANSLESDLLTIEGKLVSTGCRLNHMAVIENDRKACSVFCAKEGLPVGIFTGDGRLYPLLVRTVRIADYVDGRVRAEGQMSNGLFMVTRIEAWQGEEWTEIEEVTFGSLL